MRGQVIKNIFSNYFANFLQMGLGILIVPFLIHKLGKDAFGMVVLIESIIIFFEVLSTSIRIALSRHVTFSLSSDKHEEFLEYFSSGRYLLIFIAAVIFVLGTLASLNLQHLFKVPEHLLFQSKVFFFLAIFSFTFTIPNMVYWSVLYAKQRFDLINLAFSMGLILRALFILLIFSVVPAAYISLITYGVIYLSMKLMENSMVFQWHKSFIPNLSPSMVHFKLERVRSIVSFGLYSLISGIAFLLYENTAVILTGIFYGPAVGAIYAVSLKIPTLLKNIFSRATWTLSPTFTDLIAKNDGSEVKKLVFNYTRIIAIVTVPLCLLLILLSHQIILWWVGRDFIMFANLMVIHLLPLSIILPMEVAGCIANAHAKVKLPSQISIVIAIANVGTGIILAKFFGLGLYGFAISAAFFSLVFSGLFMPYYSCKLADIDLKKYLMNSFFNLNFNLSLGKNLIKTISTQR